MAQREELTGLLWISPWLIGFVLFTLGPALASLAISFVNLRFGSGTRFVGLDNWVMALTNDPLFWSSLLRSAYYTLLVVPIGVSLSLLAALLLNTKIKGTSV